MHTFRQLHCIILVLLAYCNLSYAAQTTDTVLMVPPTHFAFNPQTATSNAFQKASNASNLKEMALAEFDQMVTLLRKEGIRVLVLETLQNENIPDAVFPNNWLSIHVENNQPQLVLYPLTAPNRRLERQPSIINAALEQFLQKQFTTIDLSHLEKQNYFLEGTGSLVLERNQKIAFAALSPRTSAEAVNMTASILGYQPITFEAYDADQKPIYHTNVIMSIGSHFAILCPDALPEKDKSLVVNNLKSLKKEVIPISFEQTQFMCGNILEVHSVDKTTRILMSERAYNQFSKEQIQALGQYGKIIPINIDTIESVGGGGVRCMVAEVFHQ